MATKDFQTEDGRKIILRTPRWEDLDDLLDLINSLVEEGADIIVDQRVTRDEEADWFSGYLARIAKGKTISLVAQVEDKVVANSEVAKGTGRQRYVGFFGIVIAREYRGLGIGTKMMECLIEESANAGLRLLVLDVHSKNERARSLYRKMAFLEAGKIPRMIRREDGFDDCIRMYLEIEVWRVVVSLGLVLPSSIQELFRPFHPSFCFLHGLLARTHSVRSPAPRARLLVTLSAVHRYIDQASLQA